MDPATPGAARARGDHPEDGRGSPPGWCLGDPAYRCGVGFAVRVTWWGHSTAWLEDAGVTVLTDPVLRDRIAHLRRRRGPGPRLPGRPDVVLISHLHADHLDVASLRQLGPDVRLIVPAGAGEFVTATLGSRVRLTELAPGQDTRVGAVRVLAVPANHHGGRGPWSRHRAAPVGYVIEGAARTWFAGDTGLFDRMSDLGPLDLALLPVGGWGPTLGHGHLDPVAAVEAVRRSQPRQAVPVHYGTFWPIGLDRVRPDRFDRPGAVFAELAAAATPHTQVTPLQPGEQLTVAAVG